MFRVVVAGAGKIGSLIACLLAKSEDYEVHVFDQQFNGQDVVRLKAKVPTINLVEVDIQDQAGLFQPYCNNLNHWLLFPVCLITAILVWHNSLNNLICTISI